MPDQKHTNLPILDDIVTPGDSGKATRRTTRTTESADQPAAPSPAPKPTTAPVNETPSPRRALPVGTDPFIDEVIASYRPNIDSLTEEILASIMTEIEPLIREQVRLGLKRHFPDPDAPE